MSSQDRTRPEGTASDPRLPENRDAPTRPEESDKDKVSEKVEDALVKNLTRVPPG